MKLPLAVASVAAGIVAGLNRTVVVSNYGNLTYAPGEPVRLQVDLAGVNASQIAVSVAGNPVWSQVELLSGSLERVGSAHLWVTASLSPGESAAYTVTLVDAPPNPPAPAWVTATCAGANCTLGASGGTVFVPSTSAWAGPGAAPPPPLLGVAFGIADAPLLGGSEWGLSADWKLVAFSSTLSAVGPIFAEARLEYTFLSLVEATTVGVASWRVRVFAPSVRSGPLIIERHNVSIDEGVEVLMQGQQWTPTTHVGQPWFYCNRSLAIDANGTMTEDQTPVIEPIAPEGRLPNNSLGYMQPRWSQSCDSRWAWGVTDGEAAALTILAARPHRWVWPQWGGSVFQTMRYHTMSPYVYASAAAADGGVEGGGWAAAVHLPLYGAREWWWLTTEPAVLLDPNGTALANLSISVTMQELDRLTNEYILDWPGITDGERQGFVGTWFYEQDTNPTHPVVRHTGQALLNEIAGGLFPPPGRKLLSDASTWCDPDWYGASYWGAWTPENNNFETDWNVMCTAYALSVVAQGHPLAARFAELALGLWGSDLFHSITMPGAPSPTCPAQAPLRGGAGAESPGYTAHALASWLKEAPLLERYTGNATTADPRFLAAIGFLYRVSQPWAYHFVGPAAANNSWMGGRFILPLGDTHPTSVNYASYAGVVPWPDVSAWGSEELPGFGAVLQARAGTPQETFFAFKASPNRGHNHGDQLAFHLCAYGARTAIDIQAGYNPRPPQEFWHNRAAFGGNSTNMDGYERLLGTSTAAEGDVAVGQVTSQRLQWLPPLPPPIYDAVYPVTELPAPLTYRRTAVLVRAAAPSTLARDYVVLIDAHNASAMPPTAPGALSPLPPYLVFTFFQQDGQLVNPLGAGATDLGNATLFAYAGSLAGGAPLPPLEVTTDRWNWTSEGNENATRLRLYPAAAAPSPGDFFVAVLYPGGSTALATEGERGPRTGGNDTVPVPAVQLVAGGAAGTAELRVALPDGSVDSLVLGGAVLDASAEPGGRDGPTAVVALRRGASTVTLLEAGCLDLGHSQGDVGLTVLDVGYTFGEVPAWLRQARAPGGIDLPRPYLWPLNPALAEPR